MQWLFIHSAVSNRREEFLSRVKKWIFSLPRDSEPFGANICSITIKKQLSGLLNIFVSPGQLLMLYGIDCSNHCASFFPRWNYCVYTLRVWKVQTICYYMFAVGASFLSTMHCNMTKILKVKSAPIIFVRLALSNRSHARR